MHNRNRIRCGRVALLSLVLLSLAAVPAPAIQFPNDICFTAAGAPCPAGAAFPAGSTVIVDWNANGINNVTNPNAVYRYFAATDGGAKMADGTPAYVFGFLDLTRIPLQGITGTLPSNSFPTGALPPAAPGWVFQGKAEFISPDLVFNEGEEVYLNLVNLGMRFRPDLPDPHTIHPHGLTSPPVFDGEPMASFGVNMSLNPFVSLGMPVPMPQAIDLTYYIATTTPGTYLYHCHAEATEHMEMGMLGHLVVRPAQNGTTVPYTVVNKTTGAAVVKNFTSFAYNDCLPGQTDATLCGSTGYNVEKLIQLGDFDVLIHDWDFVYGSPPPNFALTRSTHFLMNGRGYPDTVNSVNPPVVPGDPNPVVPGGILNGITLLQPQPPQGDTANGDYSAQRHDARIAATAGAGAAAQSILIRVTNLSIVNPTSLQSEIPFRVVGKDARLLKGPGADRLFNTADDVNLAYAANNVLIGPGETFDLIIDTAGVPTGKYFLYSRNLEHLNNNAQDRGGAMTEIVLN